MQVSERDHTVDDDQQDSEHNGNQPKSGSWVIAG
jgi:hypothetical protein